MSESKNLLPLERMVCIKRQLTLGYCCSTQCLTQLGFKVTSHQQLSDLFSEYLLPNVTCRTTETVESVEISTDQSKFIAAFEGEIVIAM